MIEKHKQTQTTTSNLIEPEKNLILYLKVWLKLGGEAIVSLPQLDEPIMTS